MDKFELRISRCMARNGITRDDMLKASNQRRRAEHIIRKCKWAMAQFALSASDTASVFTVLSAAVKDLPIFELNQPKENQMKHFIMKYLIYIAATIFIILAWITFATAGTIQVTPLDPAVAAPQRPTSINWAGAYIGGTGGIHRDRTTIIDTTTVGDCGPGKWCDVPVPENLIGAPELDNLPDRPRFGNCGNQGSSNPFNCVTRRNALGQATELWLADPVDVVSGSHHKTTTEIIAGGFAGYRWQFGHFVPGVEVSALQTFKTGRTMLAGEVQLGFAIGRALPYLSGGYASYGGDSGPVYGAGIDFAVSRRVVIGVEAQYGDFGSTTIKTLLARVAWRF